jgi:hypothetical protein
LASRSALALLLAATVLAPRPARAGDNGAELRTAARSLAVEGAEAFDRGDFALALDRFTRAESVFAAPTIQIMRARSLEKLGRQVEALDTYEATQRTSLPADASDAFRQAIVDARVEGGALANRIPRMTLHVVGPDSMPSDLTVSVDGRPLPPALLDVERPVDPGRHTIIARADGYEPSIHSILLVEGAHHVLELPLVREGAAPVTANAGPSGTSAAPGDRAGTPAPRTAAFVLVGAGGVLLATSAVTGMRALGKQSDLDDRCDPGCPESMTEELDSYRTNRTIAYVTLALGAASLGTGGYLLWTTPSGSPSASLDLGFGSVRVRGRF